MVEVSKGNIFMGICITCISCHIFTKTEYFTDCYAKKKIKERRNQKGKSINRQSNNKI